MASGNLVSKQLLVDEIRQAIVAKESATFSLLTDMKRSVLLRFSVGKLVHIHCRGRHVDHAIMAINECQKLKFVRTNAQEKDGQELIQGEAFLAAIDSEVNPETDSGTTTTEPAPKLGIADAHSFVITNDLNSALMTPELQAQLTEIARDYIGLVADMLVPDICNDKHSLETTIEQIAEKMPAKEQSDAFRERALVLSGT